MSHVVTPQCLSPPNLSAINSSLSTLYDLGAVDADNQITPLGLFWILLMSIWNSQSRVHSDAAPGGRSKRQGPCVGLVVRLFGSYCHNSRGLCTQVIGVLQGMLKYDAHNRIACFGYPSQRSHLKPCVKPLGGGVFKVLTVVGHPCPSPKANRRKRQ